MTEFYLPYQFIPVTGTVNGVETPKTPWNQIADEGQAQSVRHDLWLNGTHSGRIVCRLRLETPTFVGAEHHKDENQTQPTCIAPYLRNDDRAIPANSLRGMIGNVAEALSQSALRVLEDRYYSVRKPMKKTLGVGPLSAIGEIEKQGEEYFLKPLTLPVIRRNGRPGTNFAVEGKWQQVFAGATLGECLPAYVDHYKKNAVAGGGEELRHTPASFLANTNPDCYGPNGQTKWFAQPAAALDQALSAQITANPTTLKTKGNFLLGQRLDGVPQLHNNTAGLVAGRMHVLGIEGRETDMPGTKKHELWIPEPMTQRRSLSIPPAVVERFARLVLDRTREDANKLPFFPKGYEPFRASNDEVENGTWRPRDGMLVFFDVNNDVNNGLEVTEISFSSIWRREVDGKSHEFFGLFSVDLLPWGAPSRTRLPPAETPLTSAEKLFGVVEQKKGDLKAMNLASRLRFADALPQLAAKQDKVRVLDEKPLKILGSPKPPSPALYFHPAGRRGQYVSKHVLNMSAHRPNGRKVYLHHPEEQINAKWWESCDLDPQNNKLKVKCAPMQVGQDFWFHVDFDNLDDKELTLLWTALDPGHDFRHRLGLAKSLGLGSVRVFVEGVFLTERNTRYGTGALSDTRRYRQAYRASGDANANLPDPYKAEREIPGARPLAELARDESLIDSDTLRRLIKVGRRDSLRGGLRVHTPLMEKRIPVDITDRNQVKNAEQKTYEWFVANESVRHPQCLADIDDGGATLKPMSAWAELKVQGLPDAAGERDVYAVFSTAGIPHAEVFIKKMPRNGTATVIVNGRHARTVKAASHVNGVTIADG